MAKLPPDKPILSIITVVFNAAHWLEATIVSVLCQTYLNIEYIIIDGGSTDGTSEIIDRYASRLGFTSSNKDEGIYDAMNKGLKAASGEYILFLNAGDRLSGPLIIQEIFDQNRSADVYYGEVQLINARGDTLGLRRLRPPEHLDWNSFQMGMLVSHQAFIARRTLAGPFDLRYRISADIDWCIRVLKKADRIQNTHRVISNYLVGGASRQNTLLSWKERYHIMRHHYGLGRTLLSHFKIIPRFIAYYAKSGSLD